jgi:AraC family transcriptional regulator
MLIQKHMEKILHGYTERVFTEASTEGARIRIVDNILTGAEISGCERNNVLRWRITPNHISAPGQLGDQDRYISFGKLMFFPKGVPFRTRAFMHSEQNRNLICYFENDLDDMISGAACEWNGSQLEHYLDINCGRIDVAMQRLVHEMTRPGFASEVMLESLVMSIAVDLTRYLKGLSQDQEELDPNRIKGLSDVNLRRITDYIMSAREGVPTSAKLADICGMNPSSFRQRFKIATGKSIHAYVEEVRLGRAKAFLTNTEMSMKEIAYELGFTHQATFTSSFRRATGVTPSGYRLMHWN